jgi:predicted transcriptional regulator
MQVELDILQAICHGVDRPTRIMYRTNLSWSVMQSFLAILQKKELVVTKQDSDRTLYSLTEKGKNLLLTYDSVKSQLDSITPLVA